MGLGDRPSRPLPLADNISLGKIHRCTYNLPRTYINHIRTPVFNAIFLESDEHQLRGGGEGEAALPLALLLLHRQPARPRCSKQSRTVHREHGMQLYYIMFFVKKNSSKTVDLCRCFGGQERSPANSGLQAQKERILGTVSTVPDSKCGAE